MKIEMKNEEMW